VIDLFGRFNPNKQGSFYHTMPRYIMFNKPDGVLTTFTDEAGRKTLKDFIPISGIYAAGRLDRDSEGLLLLTDDGYLNHRITDPRFDHPKTYLAQVEGVITDTAIDRLRAGVILGGYTTRPVNAEPIDEPIDLSGKNRPVTPHGPTAWLRLILTEGKKHEIRHMTAAVGLPTLRLIRIAVGPIQMSGIGVGEWRDLTPDEVSGLQNFVREDPRSVRRLGRGSNKHTR
jgi:23S rRNA pseudouridine2457 synthase